MTPATALRTRVKICGLCSAADALACVRAGADAVGVVLVPGSRRGVLVEEAAQIFADVPAMVARVGVFVDSPAEEVVDAAERLRLSAVQLHGAETPQYCAAVPVPVFKAFRVGGGFSTGDIEAYRGVVDAVLLDTLVAGQAGGTGRAFSWADLGDVPDVAPLIVAGGLTPANVGRVIGTLHPFAVDVSSGVERDARHKDPDRIAAFVAAVRSADDIEECKTT
jgi:phosphoribosylanthranilate isomerase